MATDTTNTDKTSGAFEPVDSKVDFIALEKQIIEWWNANGNLGLPYCPGVTMSSENQFRLCPWASHIPLR